MRRLKCHPDTPGPAIRIDASVDPDFNPGLVTFRYEVRGAIDEVAWPKPGRKPPTRLDRLWESTCFEAFCRKESKASYREFNFSPAGDWAAYSFTGYREGMKTAAVGQGLIVAFIPSHELIIIEGLASRTALAGATTFGLTVVIEAVDGTKSYWALRHPPGPPDFHHPDCFALELPALAAS